MASDQQPASPPLGRTYPAERHPCPGIPAPPLGAVPGVALQPARRRHLGGQRRGRYRRRSRRLQRLGAAHRQHLRQPARLQPGMQRRTAAIDLVRGHPTRRHASIQGALQHPAGQLALGRKAHLLGHAGSSTAIRILGPARRQVQITINQGVPVPAGVGEVDGDLGVVDLAGGAGVLASRPTVCAPLSSSGRPPAGWPRTGPKQAARPSDCNRSADRNWHLVVPSATLRR
jgi:hypothetical protein